MITVLKNHHSPITTRSPIFHFSVVFILSLLISIILGSTIWAEKEILLHTIIETACLFVSITMITVVWSIRKLASSHLLRPIGLGFLGVAWYNAMHTYYYFIGEMNLSSVFWILTKITESAILFSIITELIQGRRWILFVHFLLLPIGFSFLTFRFHNVIHPLNINGAVTPLKVAFEVMIILIYLFTLYFTRKRLKDDNTNSMLSYHYIYIYLLLAVFSEGFFAFYESTTSIYRVIGHVVKLMSYMVLFRGIIVGVIVYPYNRLEQANKSIADLLNRTPVAMAVFSEDLQLMFVNDEALTLFSVELDDISGMDIKELLKKHLVFNEGESVPKLLEQLKNSSYQHNLVRAFRTTQHQYIWIKIDCYRLDNGKYMVMLNNVIKEQQLENLQLQTRTILDALHKPILLIDQTKKIIMSNKAFEEAMGIGETDILGMELAKLTELIHFSHPKLFDKVYEKSRLSLETYITVEEGRKMEFSLDCVTVYNIEGEVSGAILIGTDITHKKDEQQKLIQQEKLALLGQMAASIVHETKNYLMTIKGSSQLLNLISKDETVIKYAGKINKAVDEVNRIVSDFLTLSRPKPPTMVETSMNDMLKSMRSMLETSSLMEGVNVSFTFADRERQVICDESQIKQVALNIAKNAVEAMEGIRYPVLHIRIDYLEIEKEMILSITDNGRGIPKEILEKIGTPFFTTKDKGTGLGLNLCFQIIEEHGGRIDIESEVGIGTTFTIALPCM